MTRISTPGRMLGPHHALSLEEGVSHVPRYFLACWSQPGYGCGAHCGFMARRIMAQGIEVKRIVHFLTAITADADPLSLSETHEPLIQ